MMSFKTAVAALALGVCVAVPMTANAGGEIQEYERTSYSAAGGGYGAYAAPMPANYARPMGAYYGSACGGYASPCGTMPYGYAYGGAPRTGGFGNDIFTAGLLGVGIGYL